MFECGRFKSANVAFVAHLKSSRLKPPKFINFRCASLRTVLDAISLSVFVCMPCVTHSSLMSKGASRTLHRSPVCIPFRDNYARTREGTPPAYGAPLEGSARNANTESDTERPTLHQNIDSYRLEDVPPRCLSLLFAPNHIG